MVKSENLKVVVGHVNRLRTSRGATPQVLTQQSAQQSTVSSQQRTFRVLEDDGRRYR
jgi:hypothetical protein